MVFIKKATVAEMKTICAAWSMAEAAEAAVGPTVAGWSSATQLEQCLSRCSEAADAFWAAVGSGPDKHERATKARFVVVRVVAGAKSSDESGGASASAPSEIVLASYTSI